MYDLETIKFAKDLDAEAGKLSHRIHVTKDDHRGSDRSIFMRDYARILYSSSFRRLQGKMQLLGISPSNFHRNRLTHSLEVAQIARTIAASLQIINPVVTESASLAHDIGNPPFGHSGEIVLNSLCEDIGGFEGNAQTFRILHTLEKKSHEYDGLNLTVRTLLAVTKYFQKREEGINKFLYDEDYDLLADHLTKAKVKIHKSIDAQIMDIADEIAYAAHDLEDAMSFNIVTVGELLHEFYISDRFKDSYEILSKLVQEAQKIALKANKMQSSEEYAVILKKELTANIINKLCRDLGVITVDGEKELGYRSLSILSKGLKKLLFKAILRKVNVQLYEKRGEKIIKGLFSVYSDQSFNKNLQLLPAEYRAKCHKNSDEKCYKRVIIDHLSGMMDSFATQEYSKYFGESELDKLYPVTEQ